MGNLLWKWTTTTTEMESSPDESGGLMSNDDITKLLYVNEEENVSVVENILDMSITDIPVFDLFNALFLFNAPS